MFSDLNFPSSVLIINEFLDFLWRVLIAGAKNRRKLIVQQHKKMPVAGGCYRQIQQGGLRLGDARNLGGDSSAG